MTLETMLSELHYISDIEQAVLQKICKDEKLIEELQKLAFEHKEVFGYACGIIAL